MHIILKLPHSFFLKRTHDEMEEEKAQALKKYLIKKTNEYKEEKIALGKRVYRFLAQGVGSEAQEAQT